VWCREEKALGGRNTQKDEKKEMKEIAEQHGMCQRRRSE